MRWCFSLTLLAVLLGTAQAQQGGQNRFRNQQPVLTFAPYQNNEAEGGEKESDEDSGSVSAEELEELQKDFDERLAELEDRWAKVDKEKDSKKNKPTFKLGGRIHLDYWDFFDDSPGIGFFENRDAGDPAFGLDPSDRFEFRRIRLEFKGDLPNNMLWRLQTEFSSPNNPQIRDVYFGWKDLPGNHTILIGNQKRPFGLDHLNSSRHNVFLERPLVIEAFNEDARRLGICLYGVSDDESLNWRWGIYNLENIQSPGEYVGDSLQLGSWARVAGTPWYDKTSGGRGYWHWALAGGVARPDGNSDGLDGSQNEARFRVRPEARSNERWLDTGRIVGAEWYQQAGVESILNIGSLQIVSEYQATFLQRDNLTSGGLQDVNFHGGYVYANYFITGEHLPINRATGTLDRVKPIENFFLIERAQGGTGGGLGAISVGYRFSYLNLTDNDITGGEGFAHTISTNWYWTPHARVQNNISYGEISDRGPIGGFDSGEYLLYGTRFAVDF